MTSPMRPLPPSAPESVVARRVLVLAPHYDDEVLGCGGLILQLAAGGAKVACAFMSDGSGGVEGPPEGFTEDEYSERRRAEADAAAKVLGIGSVEHLGSLLGLRDGSLASSLDRLTGSVEELLEQRKPDLLLAPSPLEATPDHQATFRALHEALINRRQGRTEEGEELASQDDDSSPGDLTLRVLCYEVNHPFYPDLLVDVTAEMEGVAEAMSRYSSQLERHDYMASCQGLRRFRSLSLPESCRYAEGYCQLKASDFTTRSPAQLIAHLGGAPSLVEVTSPRRVSIVVRTYNRPRRLAEALDSLARSTYRNVELVLVNDGGRPPEVAEDFPFDVRRVDFEDNRGRSAAAQAGVDAATGDCIGFLDDDDVFAPEHLETLTAQLSGDVDVAYTDAAVVSYRPGKGGWVECGRRLAYSRDFDRGILLLDNYIPFHTVLMTREAIERAGPFDEQLPVFEDWDLLIRLSRDADFVHIARTTCEYRHFLGGAAAGVAGGHALGGAASSRGDFEALKARVLAKHAAELDSDALAGAVTRMRREAVLAGEAARAQIRDRERALERLQSSHEERGGEIERLQARERELESSHEELGSEVGRLQAREQELESSHEELGSEVARLQARERELESSHEELGSEVGRLQAREQELESSHEELGSEVARLQARERELESSHQELGSEVARLQARERELESSHRELGGEVARLQARERELESSHQELGSEVERLQARERELQA
ncbi:MAG: PIG-L family deacetylase, partial [Acidobacteria bacterium]|nr:PIG-L family deacetylase [Acidobacteriota bacterium]